MSRKGVCSFPLIERRALDLKFSVDVSVQLTELDLRPPLEVHRNQHRLGSRVIERAAAQLADVFAGLYLPQLPTRHEVVRRASAMFADTPSMDVTVSRPMP